MFHLTRHKYWFFGISGLVILPGLLALIFWHLNPGIDFTGGSIVEMRSTTRRGSRSVKPSAAACNAADRQPRMVRSGHGSAGNETRGATAPMTTAASPTRFRAAFTSATRSSAKPAGER